MAERPQSGVLDTCVLIDFARIDPLTLPEFPEITAVTMAELHQGVALAKDDAIRMIRVERLGAALAEFEPLPFDGDAATRYGSLVATMRAAGRDPRPRRLDLMIAAIASIRGLPLFTRNTKDFVGLGGLVEVVAV